MMNEMAPDCWVLYCNCSVKYHQMMMIIMMGEMKSKTGSWGERESESERGCRRSRLSIDRFGMGVYGPRLISGRLTFLFFFSSSSLLVIYTYIYTYIHKYIHI